MFDEQHSIWRTQKINAPDAMTDTLFKEVLYGLINGIGLGRIGLPDFRTVRRLVTARVFRAGYETLTGAVA